LVSLDITNPVETPFSVLVLTDDQFMMSVEASMMYSRDFS